MLATTDTARKPAAASAPPAPSLAAPSSKPPTADDIANAKKQARALVGRGQMREAIPAAERAVLLDPEDAEMYLLQGAALQETGQWAKARAAFARCVALAKRGPTGECRALGSR